MRYEFLCEKCGYKGYIKLLADQRNKNYNCPKCSYKLTRLIGNTTSFILKGAGFYCNRDRKDK